MTTGIESRWSGDVSAESGSPHFYLDLPESEDVSGAAGYILQTGDGEWTGYVGPPGPGARVVLSGPALREVLRAVEDAAGPPRSGEVEAWRKPGR